MNQNHSSFAKHVTRRSEPSNVGWADYRSGSSYPAEYDSWSETDQRNYENGRLRAANVALAFGKVPTRQPQPGRNNVVVRSARAVGNSIPPRQWR